MQASLRMHWNRRYMPGSPPGAAGRASCIAATAVPDTCRSNTPSAWPKPGSNLRSAASATAATTPWWKPSTASTRPHRQHPARRGRSKSRCRQRKPRYGCMTQTRLPPKNPGRFNCKSVAVTQTSRGPDMLPCCRTVLTAPSSRRTSTTDIGSGISHSEFAFTVPGPAASASPFRQGPAIGGNRSCGAKQNPTAPRPWRRRIPSSR